MSDALSLVPNNSSVLANVTPNGIDNSKKLARLLKATNALIQSIIRLYPNQTGDMQLQRPETATEWATVLSDLGCQPEWLSPALESARHTLRQQGTTRPPNFADIEAEIISMRDEFARNEQIIRDREQHRVWESQNQAWNEDTAGYERFLEVGRMLGWNGVIPA